LLVKAGAKEDNDSKLILAVKKGDLAAVSTALNSGANVNAKYTDGKTALMVASEMGHADVVKLLLDKGADMNAKDTEGRTALTSVGPRDHAAIVQLLKEAGGIISGDDLAQSNLRIAATAQEAYWVDHETYTDSLDKLVGSQYGLYIDKGVTLQIISADKDHYQMIAFDKQGDKKYQINGPGGRIEEYTK
jgi:ankyrin repeat protein